MADADMARSVDASRAAPLCPADHRLGTHVIDHSDPAFNGLPDLRSGRTLDDAIAQLDWSADHDRDNYGSAWVAEMRDIGCSILRVRGEDGPQIQVMYPCDDQMMGRSTRGAVLVTHMKTVEGGRDLILEHLTHNGGSYGHMRRVEA